MLTRTNFQGVWNIVRFNWHQYFILLVVALLLLIWGAMKSGMLQLIIYVLVLLSFAQVLVTLLVSYYVYDLSGLYELKQVGDLNCLKVLNISAGFDETSDILKQQFPDIILQKADFYDPLQHTELSIKRARKAYPSSQDTLIVKTEELLFAEASFDKVICIFSAHEIRNVNERIAFLKELARVCDTRGEIIIMEHLRDVPNFLAYNIGFMHFYPKSNWETCFATAGLKVTEELKTTKFVSIFKLKPNGTPN